MAAVHAASPHSRAAQLALLDALTAGIGLGYLAHQYREALVANSAVIGLAMLAAFAVGYLLRLAARTLFRASSRIDAIFTEELRDKPSPWPH